MAETLIEILQSHSIEILMAVLIILLIALGISLFATWFVAITR